MTNPSLTLQGVTCLLPDGRRLFSDLDETFDVRRTGLVGRNGVGKSILARVLAGLWLPSSGRLLAHGPVRRDGVMQRRARDHDFPPEIQRRALDERIVFRDLPSVALQRSALAQGSRVPRFIWVRGGVHREHTIDRDANLTGRPPIGALFRLPIWFRPSVEVATNEIRVG